MRCTCVKEHLNALADSEISPLMKMRLRRHLQHCSPCAAELLEVQRIGEQANEWRDVTAPNALHDRVMNALPWPIEPVSDSCRPWRSGFRVTMARWRYAGGLACLLLLHWIVVGQLDAQRAALLRSPTPNSAYASAPASDTEAVASALAWRSQMLALMIESSDVDIRVNPKEGNDDAQPKNVPKRTSYNVGSGQHC